MMKMFPTWREKYLRDPGSAVTVAHIPARLGSSRIKRKNVRELGGLPLIAYSILQARAVKGIDLVYVNTESEEIAEIAREYGAEVPFMRPRHLAGTDTPMHEAIQFFYDRLRDGPMVVGKVITLYPTSPFRNVNRLGQIVASLDSSVFVHTAMKANADWGRILCKSNGRLCRAASEKVADYQPRQLYKVFGSMVGHSCVVPWGGERFQKIFLPDNPMETIDIDTPEDWGFAQRVIESGCFDFGVDIHALYN